MNHVEAALAAWAELVDETYNEHSSTPSGIAPDLNVYMNGILMYRSVGELRRVWREVKRRFPNWENDIFQAFGDENGQCTVWRASGKSHDGSGLTLDLHGVTLLDSVDGVVHTVRSYYEAESPKTAFASGVSLWPVAG
ncbi:hypothetical protein JT358_02170 [Micrococcales bacterium 31B]|nr:hypothetical protein [Micrococcales bacterium 31B]